MFKKEKKIHYELVLLFCWYIFKLLTVHKYPKTLFD